MNIYKIVLLAFYALAAIMTIMRIGKESKPTTPGEAAAGLVIMGGLATLVVFA